MAGYLEGITRLDQVAQKAKIGAIEREAARAEGNAIQRSIEDARARIEEIRRQAGNMTFNVKMRGVHLGSVGPVVVRPEVGVERIHVQVSPARVLRADQQPVINQRPGDLPRGGFVK